MPLCTFITQHKGGIFATCFDVDSWKENLRCIYLAQKLPAGTILYATGRSESYRIYEKGEIGWINGFLRITVSQRTFKSLITTESVAL